MIKPPQTLPVALTIAGSDSGGGAGIQADLKTFARIGVHGTSAITCITAQNPREVKGIAAVTPRMVALQVQAVLEAFPVAAAKTGMLYSEQIINAVVEILSSNRSPKLIVDPVMVATSGATLLKPSAQKALCHRLFPLASLVTPNLAELEILLGGKPIRAFSQLRAAAAEFPLRYGVPVLAKGGHLPHDAQVIDIYHDGASEHLFKGRLVKGVSSHGTGCTYAAAIAGFVALGFDQKSAISKAKKFISRAIARSIRSAGFSILRNF